MKIKKQNGFTGVDIVISVMIITIFVAVIANLINNINLNSTNLQNKNKALIYAVQEIEKIKAQGYIENYDDKGITQEDLIEQKDIYTNDNVFTGYRKEVYVKDYVLIKDDAEKTKNLVKEVGVRIFYNLAGKEECVEISTYIAKETTNDE